MTMTGSLWLPGAAIIKADTDGGSMLGGGAYCTWHTFEVDAAGYSSAQGARYLNSTNNQVTLLVDPVDGDTTQMLPPTRASRGLANLSGGVQTNRAGRVHIQVEVIARAGKPFTSLWTPKGITAIHNIVKWARTWGVPDAWPAGAPLGSYGAPHKRIAPAASGHYGHSQWRENSHWDPGMINILAMFPPKPPASPVPNLPTAPKPAPTYNRAKTKAFQAMLEITADGFWGSGTDSAALRMRAVAYLRSRTNLAWVQRVVDVTADGIWGPNTAAAVKRWVISFQKLLGVTADGDWGAKTEAAFQAFRKANLNKF
jgi:hypothetical protein